MCTPTHDNIKISSHKKKAIKKWPSIENVFYVLLLYMSISKKMICMHKARGKE